MESKDAAEASRRAQELRASLTARVDVEALLAEASAARQAAAVAADAIIAEAQQVSEQLIGQSRVEAERIAVLAREQAEALILQARADAEALRARAELEVEQHRRRVRAEVTEQVTRDVVDQARRELVAVREQSAAMIGDLEASVRILGVSLGTAQANVGEMLGSLESLRVHTAESLGAPDLSVPAASAVDDGADEEALDEVHGIDVVELVEIGSFDLSEDDDEDDDDEDGAEDEDGTADDLAADEDDLDPPRTATEAYLRSAHLDFGDPPLPPVSDDEVAVRYARDAAVRAAGATGPTPSASGARGTDRERVPADGRPRDRSADAEDRVVDRAEDRAGDRAGDRADEEPPARPLSWLFRNPSS